MRSVANGSFTQQEKNNEVSAGSLGRAPDFLELPHCRTAVLRNCTVPGP